MNLWAFKSAGTIRSRFAVLFLMLAVLLQASVIQTHNHLASIPVTTGDQLLTPLTESIAGAVAGDKSKPATPPVCPLCEDQALFGSYLLATPAVLAVPVATAAYYSSAGIFSSIGRQASHAWRSRAPPIA